MRRWRDNLLVLPINQQQQLYIFSRFPGGSADRKGDWSGCCAHGLDFVHHALTSDLQLQYLFCYRAGRGRRMSRSSR